MDSNQFDALVKNRLETIIDFSRNLTDKQSREFPQLLYLQHLYKSNILNIEYDSTTSPKTLAGDSGRFAVERVSGGKRLLKFSKSFRGQWLDMQEFLNLSDDSVSDALDNFLLHELFHIKQNLTTARHGDIRQAPAVLRAADYHADANAAISAFLMYSFDDSFNEDKWPNIYSRAVKAVLWQMYVFNFPAIRGDAILPSRLIRYVTWHYQYHRVRLYNPNANYRDVQLMFEPAISLRNIRGTQKITRNWAKDECPESASNSPQLWLTAPNDFGVACIFRHSAKDERHYDHLFLGVFDCNTNDSRHFFEDFFEENEELIGFGFSADDNGGNPPPDGGGPNDSNGGNPPPDGGGPNDSNGGTLSDNYLEGMPQVLVIGRTRPSFYIHRPIAEADYNPLFFHEVGVSLGSNDLFNLTEDLDAGQNTRIGAIDEAET